MSAKPNWPPELTKRAQELLAEQIKASKTITSLDFKMALRAAVGLSYNIVQPDVSKFLKANLFKDGKFNVSGYQISDGGAYIVYSPVPVKTTSVSNPEDVSLARFELLLAKLYAVRTEDGLDELEGKLRAIQAEYKARRLGPGAQDLQASSELAVKMYSKLDARAKAIEETTIASDDIVPEDLLLALKKRYAVWGMIEPDHKQKIQSDQGRGASEQTNASKSESSLLNTALGCLAAAAAISVAPKLPQLLKHAKQAEEVAR